MKKTLLALPLLALFAPLAGVAEQMIPAGSLIQCIVSDSKISSKTTAIGDPVLCQLSHEEKFGRSTFPWGSYMVGHFEAYKDPGHFVGKGWMELKFDRMVVKPDTVIPVTARVVAVPNYKVDNDGKILGKGHPVRDTVEWMIPVLWPIDLINLPRRGPSPVIKPETRLTLKLMDDVGVPDRDQYVQQQAPALIERQQAYAPQPQYAQQQQYAPQQYQQPQYAPPAAPQQVIYQYNTPAPPPTTVQVINQYPPQQQAPVVVQPQVYYPYSPAPRVFIPYGYRYGYPPGY
jgi:hypothetical protein